MSPPTRVSNFLAPFRYSSDFPTKGFLTFPPMKFPSKNITTFTLNSLAVVCWQGMLSKLESWQAGEPWKGLAKVNKFTREMRNSLNAVQVCCRFHRFSLVAWLVHPADWFNWSAKCLPLDCSFSILNF